MKRSVKVKFFVHTKLTSISRQYYIIIHWIQNITDGSRTSNDWESSRKIQMTQWPEALGGNVNQDRSFQVLCFS